MHLFAKFMRDSACFFVWIIAWTITSSKFIIKYNLNLSLWCKSFILILKPVFVFLCARVQTPLYYSMWCMNPTHLIDVVNVLNRQMENVQIRLRQDREKKREKLYIDRLNCIILQTIVLLANNFLKCNRSILNSPTATIYFVRNVSKVTTTIIFQGAILISLGHIFAIKSLNSRLLRFDRKR